MEKTKISVMIITKICWLRYVGI